MRNEASEESVRATEPFLVLCQKRPAKYGTDASVPCWIDLVDDLRRYSDFTQHAEAEQPLAASHAAAEESEIWQQPLAALHVAAEASESWQQSHWQASQWQGGARQQHSPSLQQAPDDEQLQATSWGAVVLVERRARA